MRGEDVFGNRRDARDSTARGARGARFVDEEREKVFVGRSCRRIRNRARPPTPREPRLTIDARFSNGRYYNGFGGKVEPGETIEEAALRELKEEAGIDALDMTARGVLRFIFDDNPTPWLVHVFAASKYGGEIEASDEMRPVWFDLKDVPFDSMWADDPHWWPYLLQEKKFVGTFTFTQTTTLVEYWIRESDDLSDV